MPSATPRLTVEQIEAWRTIWQNTYSGLVPELRDACKTLETMCDMALASLRSERAAHVRDTPRSMEGSGSTVPCVAVPLDDAILAESFLWSYVDSKNPEVAIKAHRLSDKFHGYIKAASPSERPSEK